MVRRDGLQPVEREDNGGRGGDNRLADELLAPAALKAPSGLAATVLPGRQVRLTRTDCSTNETAFAIWRQTATADFVRVGVVPPKSTAYTDTTVTPNTQYTYRVRAINNVGASGWSNQVSVTIPATA